LLRSALPPASPGRNCSPGSSRFALTTGTADLGADGGLEFQTNLPYFGVIDPATFYKNFCPTSGSEIINGYRVVVTNQVGGTLPSESLCAANADGLALSIDQEGAHPSHQRGQPDRGPPAAAWHQPGELDHETHRVSKTGVPARVPGTPPDVPPALLLRFVLAATSRGCGFAGPHFVAGVSQRSRSSRTASMAGRSSSAI
jgi:hypothetical protein